MAGLQGRGGKVALTGVDITRRSLFGLGIAAATAGVPFPAFATMTAAFVGQSGEPHSGRFFLGLLVAGDVEGLRAAVKDIRKATNYFRALRSRSTDKFKVEFSKRLLDHLSGDKSTEFTALDVQLSSWPKPGAERDAIVRKIAAELFAPAPLAAGIKLVDNQDAANFGHLLAVAEKSAPLGRAVAYDVIGKDDLLQVASFLTGLANNGGNAKPQSVKGQLRSHLQARLAVGEINSRTLEKHPLFRLRQLKV